MKFTREEKEKYAQIKFEDCFNYNGFYISGINDTYEFSRETSSSIYTDKVDETLKDYSILQNFNGQCFDNYPKETRIKIINIVKNCFEQLGFYVDDTKLKITNPETNTIIPINIQFI